MSDFSRIIGTKEVVCPRCGHNQSYIRMRFDDAEEFGECMNCGELTYRKVLNEAKLYEPFQQTPTVKCPYCNSTNTKKISTLSRMGSFATLGFAGKKVGKQWQCNNCKSDF